MGSQVTGIFHDRGEFGVLGSSRFDMGASIVTYTTLGVPHYNYSTMAPKPSSIIKALYYLPEDVSSAAVAATAAARLLFRCTYWG